MSLQNNIQRILGNCSYSMWLQKYVGEVNDVPLTYNKDEKISSKRKREDEEGERKRLKPTKESKQIKRKREDDTDNHHCKRIMM